MSPRLRQIFFTLFAPLTVPAYVLFLAGSNLLGGAFYIVVEASWSKLVGRPVSLSRVQMALLALPVLLLAPCAAAIHLVLAFFTALGRFLAGLGHWQVGFETRSWSILGGTLWMLAALWTSITCLNAAVGMGWVGQGVSQENKRLYVDHIVRYRVLGEMPESMQVRRRAILKELTVHQDEVHRDWQLIHAAMSDDDFFFSKWWPETPLERSVKTDYAKKLADVPWYFEPKEFSADGLDRSELMFGQLIFVWMLLIRWPGTFFVLRSRFFRASWFLARTIAAVVSVFYLASWVPLTANLTYLFPEGNPSNWFIVLSPATWIGRDYIDFVRPEWIMFNAGLWMIIIGLVILLWWLAWRVSPFLGWPRYYVAFLASRLLQRKRIAFFSVGAVTLCVAMMIIVISVMGGFVDSIRERAYGLLGDFVVDGGLRGFPYYEEFIEELGKLRDEKTGELIIEQATPTIMTYGVLKFADTNETWAVSVRGIRLNEYVRVNEFGKDLFYQKRFGGTKLDEPMGQPVFGMGEDKRAALPGDMDKHYKKYLDTLAPELREEEETRYQRDKDGAFRGPGVFKPSDDEEFKPGFEGKPYHGMIIGRDIFLRRRPSGDYERGGRYARGDPCYLTVLPLTRSGDVPTESPPRPTFRYIDDSKTGIHEIDSRTVYVDFDRLQELLMMGPQERLDGTKTSPRCSQIQIKLKSAFTAPQDVLFDKKLQVIQTWLRLQDNVPADGVESQMMRNVHVSTWEEMQRSYIEAIEKEKFLVVIMFGVISIVAVFLILCIFYMIVQEKTRDVGIIKSVGGSTEGVAAVFLVYGGAIGLVGCVLGSLLGVTFVDHINDIQNWLARINPDWRVWSPETYSFEEIPSAWKWSEVLWISVLAIVASIVGAAFPAIRAGRTWPVESLRYE
ncbi:MAG: FtsX-like permease family protein [Phycisphaerales bacterium]|nr:FtsX-like permease family protein [Phycisphaerales bacterium]